MNVKERVKLTVCQAFLAVGADRLLRHRYRNNLTVLMYHGVTKNTYDPPVWTQLPEDIFEEQIKWISETFHPVTLGEMILAVQRQHALPPNSILITFDDGLKNNVDVAYPILKKYNMPATIFLTVDFIGTDRFFWVDELYLALQTAYDSGKTLVLSLEEAQMLFDDGNVWAAYHATVEFLKVLPDEKVNEYLSKILSQIEIDRDKYNHDFGTMTWDDVRRMDVDPLISFGAHTANHRILTRIPSTLLQDELIGSRERMEVQLGHSVSSFCYPNGRLGLDFLPEHMDMLRDGGYGCAFATNRGLFDINNDDRFSIPRVSVGNDFLSMLSYFKLNVSGFVEIRTNKGIQLKV